jgi:hypothetical protein
MEPDKPQAVILYTYENTGVLPTRYLKRWLWADQTDRAMNKQLKKMEDGEFIKRPSKEDNDRYKIPENFVYLDWRGALVVAAEHGVKIEEPDKANETWQRQLVKDLRANGLYWRRNPPWNNLEHEFLSVDWRVRFLHDVKQLPFLQVEADIAEYVFRLNRDSVRFPFPPTDPKPEMRQNDVIPDGYFAILDRHRQQRGEPAHLRLPYEVDNHSHAEAQGIGPKFAAYAAWLKSPAYKARFGDNSGAVLVIAHGGKRLANMMAEAARHKVDWAFLFTTFDTIEAADNLLTAPIWRRAQAADPIALFPTSSA